MAAGAAAAAAAPAGDVVAAGIDVPASAPTIQFSRSTSHFIEEGDLILVYLSHNRNPLPVVVHAGATHVNSFGAFPHSTAFLGKPFGSRVNSLNGRGFVYVLRPTPELWTLSLPHRTQILYQADIAFITHQLRLVPGARIIEAGTGSGSFTHSLARTVGRAHQVHRFQGTGSESVGRNDPRERAAAERVRALGQLDDTADDVPTDGRVFSFEFHAQRHAKAKVEFAAHGLSGIVRMTHRNVCKDGFMLSPPRAGSSSQEPPSANGTDADQPPPPPPSSSSETPVYPIVNAVFLDLPAPWEAVPLVTPHLDKSRTTRICCFSPCIEQVLKTVTALNTQGFSDVQTWEVLMREVESTPLAKATRDDDDWDGEGENDGAKADEAAEEDGEAEAEEAEENDVEEVNGEGGSASGKSRQNGGGKGNKAKQADGAAKLGKRKRDDASASSSSATQAALHKTRWGLERPRDVTSVIKRILKVEERKEVRRVAQVTKAKEQRAKRHAAAAAAAAASASSKQEESAAAGSSSAAPAGGEQAKAEEQENGDVTMDLEPSIQRSGDREGDAAAAKSAPASALTLATPMPRLHEPASVYGRILPEMRGHTSYLTFGTMLARVPGADVVPAPSNTNGASAATSDAAPSQS
ncbi:tRNA (adenine-N(1)-)-methyltransferase catalytic subunit trm61 [Tilletia horrida]|nr:tRNA (adenine-N(1)-)-methyltransferase catalytic subunit trm61 [Tilletia horrida]